MRPLHRIWLFALAFCFLYVGVAGAQQDQPSKGDQRPGSVSSPLSPADSIAHFKLSDSRLQIELVASEPQIADPVAAQFDERGRLWVVEMGDYPHGPAPGQTPQSRIKILEDRDGDGSFETAHNFAEHLLFVTELQPWKGGAIVTLAGEVAYFADRDGDGKSDERQTWYGGFAQENSQLRANHPRLGLDGWIYVSNGLRGGSVKNPRVPDSPEIPLAGKDFRFHPVTFEYEAITGVGQFGLTFDDFGNRFICSNRNPLMHVVLEDRYIQRNPKYAPSAARHDVARAAEESRIYALSRAWTTSNLHAGQFTAACGVLIYRGTALPSDFYGAGFTCDPTGNLVHGEFVQAKGATFTSQPVAKEKEFIASPDEWFRPVNLFNGPDGALYVVDMYRAVIEHPDFMPDELKKRSDLMLGTDRGRIWRITTKNQARPERKSISDIPNAQLVSVLGDQGWNGDTAFRLLYERQSKEEADRLIELAKGESTLGRIRALWLLQHLGALPDDTLRSALRDQEARVREQAVKIAEMRMASASDWRMAVVPLAADPDAKVRFQVAMSLAPVASDEELRALQSIAIAGVDDEWTRRATALAAGARSPELARAVLSKEVWPQRELSSGTLALFSELFGCAAAQRNAEQLTELLRAICDLEPPLGTVAAKRSLLLAFADASGRSGSSLNAIAKTVPADAQQRYDELLAAAKKSLRESGEVSERMAAAQLLGYDEKSTADLAKLLHFSSEHPAPPELRLRVLASLARQSGFNEWTQLLTNWPRESPAFRRGLLEAMLSRPERTTLLLDAIESGQVKPSELETAISNRLIKHGQPAIRQRAEKLLASLVPEDRQKVLQQYQPVLKMKADSIRGKQVFAKNCSTCHRIGDLGVNVAPDISDSRVKQPEQLLTDILQPNRAIDNNFLSYSVVTSDGLTLTGVIAAETGTSITLRQQEGKEATFLRSNIEELRSNGVSLMPEGLEKNIPPQDMADLIAFIKNWRYLDGRTPFTQ